MDLLSKAAAFVREAMDVNRLAAADDLKITPDTLAQIEAGVRSPEPFVDNYREAFGVDLYIVAVVFFTDVNQIPEPLREASESLRVAWRQDIEATLAARRGR